MYLERTQKFLALSLESGAQGAMIHKPSNMRYLSGYTGEGLLVIAEGLRAIVTDFRYTEQAEAQAPGYSVHMVSNDVSHAELAAQLLKAKNTTTVSFEDDEVTVADFAKLEAAFEGIRLLPQGSKVEKLREIKDDSEIALLEKACAISSQAFEHIISFIRPGLSELEVRFELESTMYRLGAEQLAFDTIIAAGPNGSLPHAVPSDYKIQPGDLVTMDYGAKYGGYCADITRTVAVGSLDGEKLKVYETVLKAQLLALDAIRPGTSCREVDAIARSYIDSQGFAGRFGHGLGHGVGLDIHEAPRMSMGSTAVLEEGIVITNEPGIYLPGQCGCRIEDTVLVTKDGCRRLTTAPKELITL